MHPSQCTAIVPQPTAGPLEDPPAFDPIAYADAVAMGYDAGYAAGFRDGLAAADAHEAALHRAASRVTEWVARDMLSGRPVTREDRLARYAQRDLDREAAELYARVHGRELVTT